ncbi:MAG: hypothetical protein ACXWEY_11580 [Bacteroidia bacterium]
MKKLLPYFILCLLSVAFLSSCGKEGCTDPLSSSYDSEATDDDGTCNYYYGGREFSQLEVAAIKNSGSQQEIFFDGNNIGTLKYYFPNGVSCGNPNSVGTVVKSGRHLVKAVGVNETREGYITIDPQECKVVLVEDLPLVNPGGGGGSTLDGKWKTSSGNGVIVSGSVANFYVFSSTWQEYVNMGLINIGDEGIKSITKVSANEWSCFTRHVYIKDQKPQYTFWSNDGKLTLSNDGNTMTIVSNVSAGGENKVATSVFYRQ